MRRGGESDDWPLLTSWTVDRRVFWLFSSLVRSAPRGRQQMGETGFCENLRFSAVSCENLRFPAVFCANLRLPNPLIYRASRKSAKICKNLRKCAFRVRFLPFAVSLLARPDKVFRSWLGTMPRACAAQGTAAEVHNGKSRLEEPEEPECIHAPHAWWPIQRRTKRTLPPPNWAQN